LTGGLWQQEENGMSSISESGVLWGKSLFKRLGQSLSQQSLLGKETLQRVVSRDSLTLMKNQARNAKYARLKALKPPKMGLIERVMSKVREFKSWLKGTGDTLPYANKVRLKNFGQVDKGPAGQVGIYRGAMPMSGKEYEKLANAYDVKHIIDLRGFETTSAEHINGFGRGWAGFHGIRYHHIPMSSAKEPSTDDLAQVFKVIDEAGQNGEGVYIHCKHGIDRTGSVFAAIEEKLGMGKSAPERIKQMRNYGYNAWHQHSKPAQAAFVTGDDFSDKVRAAVKQTKVQ
jgi:hypothetical protein